MKKAILLFFLLLIACNQDADKLATTPAQKFIAMRVHYLVVTYNSKYHTNYPQPEVVFDDIKGESEILGEYDYALNRIHYNNLWVQHQLCMVVKEAIPHEIAHEFDDFDKYGAPRTMLVNNGQFITTNGPPPLQDDASIHNDHWKLLATRLGADVCREGYCPVSNPYSLVPPVCPGLDDELNMGT